MRRQRSPRPWTSPTRAVRARRRRAAKLLHSGVTLAMVTTFSLAGITTTAAPAEALTIAVPSGEGPQAQMANHTGYTGGEREPQPPH